MHGSLWIKPAELSLSLAARTSCHTIALLIAHQIKSDLHGSSRVHSSNFPLAHPYEPDDVQIPTQLSTCTMNGSGQMAALS